MTKTVLVIAAHSDDEASGCAGTLVRHVSNGDEVHIVYMTDGVGARLGSNEDTENREIAAKQACDLIQISSARNLHFPDNKMDSVALLSVTQALESVISELKPDIIYTNSYADLNIDHQITHKAVMIACRPVPGCCVTEIYAFEVLSSTEWQTPDLQKFIPTVFIDISRYIDTKRMVLEAYNCEMRDPPHSRSIDNLIRLSALRGNSVGVNYAEAFSLIRLIKSEL